MMRTGNSQRKQFSSLLLVLCCLVFCLSACTKCRTLPLFCEDDNSCPEGMICVDYWLLDDIHLGTRICAYDILCGGIAGIPCPEECLTCVTEEPCCDFLGVCAPGLSGVLAISEYLPDDETNNSF
jgi:hypothetical protein